MAGNAAAKMTAVQNARGGNGAAAAARCGTAGTPAWAAAEGTEAGSICVAAEGVGSIGWKVLTGVRRTTQVQFARLAAA
jgi:hypothetical protein